MLSNTLTSQHTWLHEVWLGAFRCHQEQKGPLRACNVVGLPNLKLLQICQQGVCPEEAALLAQDGRPSASDEQVLQALIQQPDAMSLLHLPGAGNSGGWLGY